MCYRATRLGDASIGLYNLSQAMRLHNVCEDNKNVEENEQNEKDLTRLQGTG